MTEQPPDDTHTQPLNRRATLADVAALAGVSLGSASRALSVPEQVKPATLKKVAQAVAALGYIRNGSAQALASRRTRTVAALYPTLDNPIFAQSTHSMQQTLWSLGYQLLIASHEYQIDNEFALLRATVERGVDGLILVGTDHSQEIFTLLHQRGLPYVLTWSTDDSTYPHCVGISNFHAAYKLAREVIAKGHTRIGLCGGAIERNERARGRRLGILAALKEAGLKMRKDWIFEAPFSYAGGRQAIQYFWSLKQRPTAILFGTDLQAIGALHQCREQGIRVPDDLSIIGFDGIEEAEMMQPALTTLRIPAHEIGRRAAHRIVALIEGTPVEPEPPLSEMVLIRESLGQVSQTNQR